MQKQMAHQSGRSHYTNFWTKKYVFKWYDTAEDMIQGPRRFVRWTNRSERKERHKRWRIRFDYYQKRWYGATLARILAARNYQVP